MSFEINELTCPISFKVFENAQKVNCPSEHTFDLQSVISIFGRTLFNGQCEYPGPCPLCRERVTSYSDNSDLQEIVKSTYKKIIAKSHPDNIWVRINNGQIEKIALPELKILCSSTTTIHDLKDEILLEVINVVSPTERPLTLDEIRVVSNGRIISDKELVLDVDNQGKEPFWYVTR